MGGKGRGQNKKNTEIQKAYRDKELVEGAGGGGGQRQNNTETRRDRISRVMGGRKRGTEDKHRESRETENKRRQRYREQEETLRQRDYRGNTEADTKQTYCTAVFFLRPEYHPEVAAFLPIAAPE